MLIALRERYWFNRLLDTLWKMTRSAKEWLSLAVSLLSVGCFTSCADIANELITDLEAKQEQTVRSSGVTVKLVIFNVPLGGPACGGPGTQFNFKPSENERVPPDPINADYPFYGKH
jgi:hypothetical protein